jgi:hypothetical protein
LLRTAVGETETVIEEEDIDGERIEDGSAQER